MKRCALDSGAGGRLACDRKIVVNLAVPSGASGGESSLVAQVVEVEENDTQAMQTIRDPPVITINKSAAYALYAITYIRQLNDSFNTWKQLVMWFFLLLPVMALRRPRTFCPDGVWFFEKKYGKWKQRKDS